MMFYIVGLHNLYLSPPTHRRCFCISVISSVLQSRTAFGKSDYLLRYVNHNSYSTAYRPRNQPSDVGFGVCVWIYNCAAIRYVRCIYRI